MAVVDEMKAAGVHVFAGGLEEGGPVFSADAGTGTLTFTDGPYVETKESLGGLTVVDVADEESAKMWAGKLAEARAAGPRRFAGSGSPAPVAPDPDRNGVDRRHHVPAIDPLRTPG